MNKGMDERLDQAVDLLNQGWLLTLAHGAKTEMVIAAIQKLTSTFRYADLVQACPNVIRPTIKQVLQQLRQEGKIECVRPGRDEEALRGIPGRLTKSKEPDKVRIVLE